ncbi:MAG: hypothetical protein ABSC08_06505 [Bryobacteraceae bacterium]
MFSTAGPFGSEKAKREQLLQRAQADFAQAASMAGHVPAIDAVTGLHLANVLAMRGDLAGARHHFHESSICCHGIENGWVQQYASEIRHRVELPSSVLLLDVSNVEKALPDGRRLYDAVETALRDFMLSRAHLTDAGVTRTSDEAAQDLGVGRATLAD